MRKILVVLAVLALVGVSGAGVDHLLLSEVCTGWTNVEFMEIYNPTMSTVDLSNYYITDDIYHGDPWPDYVNVVDGTAEPYHNDFLAKFPDGAVIGPGEAQVVAVNGANLEEDTGYQADYELHDSGTTYADMVDPGPGWIGADEALITGSGEIIILFYWDGTSDLVQDVDMCLWGDKEEAVDKTGVSKDGPDAGSEPSTYLDDTPISEQDVVSAGQHDMQNSWQRNGLSSEGDETLTGGNGITGNDETSENLSQTWTQAPFTPGEAYSKVTTHSSWGGIKASFRN